MTRKYFPDQELRIPERVTHSSEVRASFEKLPGEFRQALDRVDSQAYINAATARSRVLNLYIDQTKPWALAKLATPESMAELHEVLYTLLQGIAICATALAPAIPFGPPEIFRQLAASGAIRIGEWGKVGFRPLEPSPVFPRLEMPPKRFVVSIDVDSATQLGTSVADKKNLKLVNGAQAFWLGDFDSREESETFRATWVGKLKKPEDKLIGEKARIDEKPTFKSVK